MAMEIVSERAVCYKCGTGFGKKRGNFLASYGALYKGSGFLPYCKACVDKMFDAYYGKCGKMELAVHQMCRILNLYWNKKLYDQIQFKATNKTIMTTYIAALNRANFAGKSYEDTLTEADMLWSFTDNIVEEKKEKEQNDENENEAMNDTTEIPKVRVTKKMVKFWGSQYTPEMITQLEERYQYWVSRLPEGFEIDMGTEVLLKQISALDIDINTNRAGDGKNVDKLIATQSNLLRDLSLKPSQRKKDDGTSLNEIPFGVGIAWCENKKPITEPAPEFKDVDGIRRYENIWLYGHLAKMMGKKNAYSKLYEQEIAKMKIEHPEYADEDDEDFLADVLSSDDDSWPGGSEL